MTDFVDVVVTATGERVVIPRHWLDDDRLKLGYEPYVPPEPVEAPVDPAGTLDGPVDGQEPVEPPVQDPPPAAPAHSANKPDWIAWAVFNGADPDEADAATKDRLIADYGTPA